MRVSFDDRFDLVRQIGEGEFATVHEAADKATHQRVALKWARADVQLREEFQLARAIEHPCVLRPFELDVLEGRDAIVMPLIDSVDIVSYVRHDLSAAPPQGAHLPMAFGQPLQPVGTSAFRRCSDGGIMRLRRAFARLSSALQAVHAAGVAHRDLRPANVRVTAEGELCLIDFGLAARIGTYPARDAIGTVSHLAPECAVDTLVTAAEDWYAVGVLAFEALTGELPFFGTGQDVLLRKQTVGAPSPDFYVSRIPRDLARTCSALLEPAPALRASNPDFENISTE